MTNDQKLDTILTVLAGLAVKLDAMIAAPAAQPAPASPSGPTPPASDADLDAPRGDPEVRFCPKRWEGRDYKGLTFSATEPDFLEMLAETFDYFARKEDCEGTVDKNGGPKSYWTRKDAARARGWALRLAAAPAKPARRVRTSAKPSPAAAFGDPGGDFENNGVDQDIPF